MQFPYLDWLLPLSEEAANNAAFDPEQVENDKGVKPSAYVGRQAPDFQGEALHGTEFKNIKLSDYRNRYVVLYFYPLNHTFLMPVELQQYSDAYDDFQKHNCEVIACSVDTRNSHLQWVQKPNELGGIDDQKIVMLGDSSKVLGRKYGVYIHQYGCHNKGVFIIDRHGILRHAYVNGLPSGREPKQVLRRVLALQNQENIQWNGEEWVEVNNEGQPQQRVEERPARQQHQQKPKTPPAEQEDEEEGEEYEEEEIQERVVVKKGGKKVSAKEMFQSEEKEGLDMQGFADGIETKDRNEVVEEIIEGEPEYEYEQEVVPSSKTVVTTKRTVTKS